VFLLRGALAAGFQGGASLLRGYLPPVFRGRVFTVGALAACFWAACLYSVALAADFRRTISNFIEYATINYIFNNNIVDDSEMNELVAFEKGIQAGMEDIKMGRYKIIG
jgi:hypothetical protein